MERVNKDRNPIYYKNSEEMDKPLNILMEELRCDISKVRGKLSDISRSYNVTSTEHLEGGLTCMLVAMHATMMEWKEMEEKQ